MTVLCNLRLRDARMTNITLFLHRNTLNIKLSNFGIILVEDFYGHISLDMNLKTKNSKTENKTKCAP